MGKKKYADASIVSELAAKIDQPHLFARIFCDAAREQVSIREELKYVIRDTVETDYPTRNSIRNLFKDHNREG